MPKGARFRPFARAVLRTQSDDRLVRLVRAGSDTAFEEIVRRYRPPLVAFAAAYGPPDPEDVVQESLTRSWQSLRQSTGEMNLKPWLYTIVRNRALNAKRNNRAHEELTDQIDGVRQPADIVLTNEELGRVVAAVAALPQQQREALVRSALEGHTHEQIGAAIGASPGAVRQLIFRGRTAVRQGVGLLIPLPLVRALAETGAAEVGTSGTAAAGGGAMLAGGGAGAGASIAAKAAIVVAVGAVAAGSGVAIDRASDPSAPKTATAREIQAQPVTDPTGRGGAIPTAAAGEDRPAAATDDSSRGSSGDGADDGPGERRDLNSASGDSAGSSSGPDDGASGSSNPSASSGPGSSGSDDGPDESGEESSGLGHSGSGHSSGSSGSDDPSGSDDHSPASGDELADDSPDSSGPGSSGDGSGSDHDTTVEAAEQPTDDSGGSGPGSDGSGSDGGGGSGSGQAVLDG
jgi:RNA polymerase sigma factor (sigma-70 family)